MRRAAVLQLRARPRRHGERRLSRRRPEHHRPEPPALPGLTALDTPPRYAAKTGGARAPPGVAKPRAPEAQQAQRLIQPGPGFTKATAAKQSNGVCHRRARARSKRGREKADDTAPSRTTRSAARSACS